MSVLPLLFPRSSEELLNIFEIVVHGQAQMSQLFIRIEGCATEPPPAGRIERFKIVNAFIPCPRSMSTKTCFTITVIIGWLARMGVEC